MLLTLLNSAFSGTKWVGATITLMGIICILLVSLTTWVNLTMKSTTPFTSAYFVAFMPVYSWAWECNNYGLCFLCLIEKINITFPAGSHSWNWTIGFGIIPLLSGSTTGGDHCWKELSRTFSPGCLNVSWMLWDSDIINRFGLVYSILQSSYRCSTEVGLQNGWWLYNCPV